MDYKKIAKKTGRLMMSLPSVVKNNLKGDVQRIQNDFNRAVTSSIRKVKNVVKKYK